MSSLGEVAITVIDGAYELLSELFAVGLRTLKTTSSRRRGSPTRAPGTMFRPRRAMTLTGVDLRHADQARSFSVSLTRQSTLKIARAAHPAGTEVGLVLDGDDSAIPEPHRAVARAYGYEIAVTEQQLAASFIALPPRPGLSASSAPRLR